MGQIELFRVDLGVMAMKGYSTFPKAPGLELYHQQFSIMPHTFKKKKK